MSVTVAEIHLRCSLLKVDGVAFLSGRSVGAIWRLVEGGHLPGTEEAHAGFRWVFNVAINATGDQRDLRFWSREVVDPKLCEGLELKDVLALILPESRTHFATGEITGLFQVRREHIRRLRDSGQLPGGTYTPRATLAKFLSDRLVVKAKATGGAK